MTKSLEFKIGDWPALLGQRYPSLHQLILTTSDHILVCNVNSVSGV